MKTETPQGENPTDCAYTHPTGAGYLAVYRLGAHRNAELIISTAREWPPGTRVGVETHDDRVRLVAAPDGALDVRTSRGGDRYITLPANITSALGVEPGEDVRLYDRGDDESLTVVARDRDPFVGGAGR